MGNKRKGKGRRWIASLLVAVMLVSVLPVDVLAAELMMQDAVTVEYPEELTEEITEEAVAEAESLFVVEEEEVPQEEMMENEVPEDAVNFDELQEAEPVLSETEAVLLEAEAYQQELEAEMMSESYVDEMDKLTADIEANALGNKDRSDFKDLYGVSYEGIFKCCPAYLNYPFYESTMMGKMEGYVVDALNVCDQYGQQAEFYYKLSQGINYPINQYLVAAGIKDSDYEIFRKQVAQKVVEDYLATANQDLQILQEMQSNLSGLTKVYNLATEYSNYVADVSGGFESLAAMGSGTIDSMIAAVASAEEVTKYAGDAAKTFGIVTEIMALQEIEVQTIDFLIETLSVRPDSELAKGLQALRADIEMDPAAYVVKYYCTDKIVGTIVSSLGNIATGGVYEVAEKLYNITVGVANYIYELKNPSYEEIEKAYIAWSFYLDTKSIVNKYKKMFMSGYRLGNVAKYEAAYSLNLSSMKILMTVSAKCLKRSEHERLKNSLLSWSSSIGTSITYDSYIAGCGRLIKADLDSGVLTITETEDDSSNINTPGDYDSTESVSARLTAIMSQYVPNVGQTWNGEWGGAVQCFGFARMVFSLLFGCEMPSAYYGSARYQYATENNVELVGQLTGGDVTAANVSNLMAQAKVGDIIQANGAAYGQHTMVMAGATSGGVTVYDCNAHLDSAVDNVIHTHNMSWNTWVSWYGSSNETYGANGISLYRASNYASIYGNGDDLFYDDSVNFVIENGVLKKYNGFQPFVVIPEGVTEIGSSAFENNKNMVSVEIPEGVEKIGNYAFYGCSGLVGVYIPDSVTEIGGKAFANCTNLKQVTLSKNLQGFDYGVFYNCTGLTEITIPKSVQNDTVSHGYEGPFEKCSNLKQINFESGIKLIPSALFRNCDGLEQIEIPDSVTKIGDWAFDGCINLTEVKMPETVTEIGWAAFAGCTKMKEISLPDSVMVVGGRAFANCTNLKQVTLSKNLQGFDYGVFYNCTGLTEITIPKSVQNDTVSHGYEGPFEKCSNLKQINFESGIKLIPSALFRNCDGLEQIEIPDSVTKIGDWAFDGCINLTEVKMPETVTEIGWAAFAGCTKMKEISLPDSVTEIGGAAFSGCTKMEEISLPDSVMVVGGRAFANCTNLKQVTLSKNLQGFDYGVFYNCTGLTEITIPKSVQNDTVSHGYEGPFEKCSNLKQINFESGIKLIPSALFRNCDGLEQIEIPNSVTEIGDWAFDGCINLTEVKIPKSVTEIGWSAFSECTKLTEITIPNSVTAMEPYVFSDCSKLQRVHIPNTQKIIPYNMFYNCTSLSEINLPSTLTEIQEYAFYNCDALTQVTIPSNVTEVERYAFYDCDTLTKAVIPDSVSSMGSYVFSNCDVLTDLTVGNGCATIPEYAFSDCGQLASVVLPYGVKSISAYAFKNDPKLTAITIPRSTTSIASGVFSYPSRLTIYGVSGTYPETYANDNNIKFVNQSIKATSVTLNKKTLGIERGMSEQLVASVKPVNHTDEITWVSSDSDIVRVSETGKITGVAKGQADITVIVGGVSATCTVTVTQQITDVYLDRSNLTLKGGESYTLKATIYPSDATNKTLSWTSSDSSVATVDDSGKVTGIKIGVATITVQAGSKQATCKVAVTSNGGQDPNQPIDPDVPEKEWYFTDIPKTPGYWKYDNVKYVYDRGVMNGISGTTLFEPDSKLNRAMFATVLYRMAGSPEVTFTDKFTDVKDGQYYSKAVIWANSKGIVSGFQDGSYGVTANITREQIAKMLCEYAKRQGYDVSGASSLESYTDKDNVNSWAVNYLKWAVNTGMISGKPNGDGSFRLDPKGEATRAECAKMLTMFMKKYEE